MIDTLYVNTFKNWPWNISIYITYRGTSEIHKRGENFSFIGNIFPIRSSLFRRIQKILIIVLIAILLKTSRCWKNRYRKVNCNLTSVFSVDIWDDKESSQFKSSHFDGFSDGGIEFEVETQNHSKCCFAFWGLRRISFACFISLGIFWAILNSWRSFSRCFLSFNLFIGRSVINMQKVLNFSIFGWSLRLIRKWTFWRYSFLSIIWYIDHQRLCFNFSGRRRNFQSSLGDTRIEKI